MTLDPVDASEADPKFERIRRNAIRMMHNISACYLASTAVLFGFVLLGVISLPVVLLCGVMGTLSCGLFYLVLFRRWTRGFRDPGLTAPHMACTAATQLLFLGLAPEVGVLFMFHMFLIYGFGILAVNGRHFIMITIAGIFASGAVIFLISDRLAFPTATLAGTVLVWIDFSLTLGYCVYISTHVNHLRAQLRRKNGELASSFERIKELVNIDELTGVANRRALMAMITEEQHKARRTGDAFCAALLDLDHFKNINDTFGHGVGDKVLKAFASLVSNELRAADRFGRFGGEEFLLVLGSTSIDDAIMPLERVMHAVERYPWQDMAPRLCVTVSIGVAAYRNGETIEELLARADAALYDAKAGGRNRIMIAAPSAAITPA